MLLANFQNAIEYLKVSIDPSLHIHLRRPQEAKLKEMSELLLAYLNLAQRLVQALEFAQFDDIAPELESEAYEIERLLEKISTYAYLTNEDDYCGAFVTIRGEYHDWPDHLPAYEPENHVEVACIDAISAYLTKLFVSEIVYASSDLHKTGERRPYKQEEITIWVKDMFEYGVLKMLAGQYLLFGKQRVVTLYIDVSPVLPQAMPGTDWANCRIRVLPWMWSSTQKIDNIVEVEHIPSKIKACASSERSQLLNRTNAAKLLQSRIYQAAKANKQKKARYSYVWGERVIIDNSSKQIYPFSKATEISKMLIKALETIPEFSAE